MERIYLDNSATSWPKVPGMAKAIYDYIEEGTVNLNRTESNKAFPVFDRIYALREKLARLYNYNHPECVCFTKNITESLNWIIKGMLKKSDHVIVSANEHNATMRPLVQMGIDFTRIPSNSHGFNDYSTLDKLLKPNTRAIFINAAGNVSGAIQDLEVPAEFAKRHNLLFFIDSAQASPFIDIDMEKLNLAGVAFTGHKGFLGPQGIGGMILRKEIALSIDPLISGGTGSESDKETIPESLPDRLTAGTENIPGMIGLAHSFDYIIANKDELKENLRDKTNKLLLGIMDIDNLDIAGARIDENRTSVVSFTSKDKDIAYISYELLKRNGIESRVGLHCAPNAHKVLGTFPTGTLRLSPGVFTSDKEIEIAIKTLKEIANE